jgi:HEPN domain-containing protein
MNRSDFQQLADVRIAEAKVLLDAGKWDGAYYLAGYAVECALKACIAKLTRAEDFPPRETKDYYTHDLNALLKPANLKAACDAEGNANMTFKAYWQAVVQWKEDARYKQIPQRDAEELYKAISDPTDGVLRWIRLHW